MSRGNNLQEMEVGTKQSKTAVNAGAKSAEPMQKLSGNIPDGQTGSWEDLGGPTPENYKSDDDSAKLNTPGATLKQVKDVVTKGAKPAETAKAMREEELELDDEEVIAESEEEELEDEDLVEGDEEEEEEEVVEEEYDIDEDVNALIEGEDLSEEFREKARTIFEAAITSRVGQIKEDLEALYEERLVQEVEEIKEALSERVDSYLEYVSDEWFTENSLTIEGGLKEELTESFMTGLKGLFEEHYVSIPEDKYNVLESMVEKLDEMETKLNEQIEKNVSLNKRLAESVADGIFEQVSEGLAATQKDKLASLAESVEFESEEEYREKLETLKESYFSRTPATKSEAPQTLSEGVDSTPAPQAGGMDAYLRSLGAFRQN